MPNSFQINVDLTDVISEFALSGSDVNSLTQSIVDEVTEATYRQWKEEARRGLRSTRQQYVRGLQLISEGRLRNSIILRGKFPNMLEFGISSFDMKVGFANSKKSKRSKDGGWFLTIPFRMAVPGAEGESEVFSGVLPRDVYKAVRKSARSGKKVLSKEDIPAAFSQLGSNSTTGYKHKHSIYEGLQRTTKFYEETTQGQYNTFRRVSSKSDPNSWIHKGLKEHAFAEKAIRNSPIDTIVENAIDQFLSER